MRFAREQEMAAIRAHRDQQICDITSQEREQLEAIRTSHTAELQGVLASQGHNSIEMLQDQFALFDKLPISYKKFFRIEMDSQQFFKGTFFF